jgi:PAS domain-containing protein
MGIGLLLLLAAPLLAPGLRGLAARAEVRLRSISATSERRPSNIARPAPRHIPGDQTTEGFDSSRREQSNPPSSDPAQSSARTRAAEDGSPRRKSGSGRGYPAEGKVPKGRGLSGDEGEQKTARERRIERAERRERVRSALRAAAAYGYYVFDDLTTEDAGNLDYLAIGPASICAVIIRDEIGVVTAAEDMSLRLDGRPFEDDPRAQAEELTNDVFAKLNETVKPIDYLICFTRAEIRAGADTQPLCGVCTLWTLSSNLDPEGEEEINAAEVEELAESIQRTYGRRPFVTPHDDAFEVGR